MAQGPSGGPDNQQREKPADCDQQRRELIQIKNFTLGMMLREKGESSLGPMLMALLGSNGASIGMTG